MQNLKKKMTCAFKNDMRNLASFYQSIFGSLKIVTLMGSFYPKSKMYELKIYWGVLCHDNEKWYKISRGIDLSVQNWHEEFDKFGPEHSKISKICNLMGFFWTKYIMFELKKYRGIMFDGTEHWCNIWRKSDLCFEKWLFLAIQQTATHKEHLWYSFWSEAIFWSSSETLAPWS